MAKLLFISNISNGVGTFAAASIIAAKRCGLKFYYASNWNAATDKQMMQDEKKYGIKLVHVDFERSPYSTKNLKACVNRFRSFYDRFLLESKTSDYGK